MEYESLDYSHLYSDFYKNKVYLPSDDTFFFTDVLLKDFDDILERRPSMVLELGSGSGYITTYFLKLFERLNENGVELDKDSRNKDKDKDENIYTPFCVTVDVNKFANLSTKHMVKSNNLENYCEYICMDLFSNFSRVKFDMITFNPPYVPGTTSDVTNVIDSAWNGGKNGCETIKRFLNVVDRYLAENGVVYLLLEKQNNVEEIIEMIRKKNYEYKPKVKLRLCEQLRIHAPHVFSKQPPNVQESLHNFPNKYQPQLQPPFPVGPPYHHSQMMPPEADNLGHSHKHEPMEKPMDNMYSRNNLVWQGNVARNGKKQVESVAISISGQCSTFLNPGLEMINITHRLKWEEASKNLPLAVFSLHPSNNAKLDSFLEYIEYFQTKNRIGVAPLQNDHNLYVCAPGNPLYDKHLPEGVSTPTLIGIAVSAESPTPNQPARLQQSNGDWLNQLSTITAMLGTKK